MSDLQIALAAIGLLVVGGVYAYNIWQERKLQQRLERAFEGERDDVLLKTAAEPEPAAAPRIEPRIGSATAHAPKAVAAQLAESADSLLEFIVEIELPAPAGDAALHGLMSQLATFGKPARLLGWDEAADAWLVLGRGADGDFHKLLAALQLVNRAGPVNAPQLNGFCDAVRAWAEQHDAELRADDVAETLQAARELDAFCGDADVAIGLNLVAQKGGAFGGEQLAATASAVGFSLEADGMFHWRDGGKTLFTMENHEPEPFSEERLAAMQTSGLTLLLDVPRVADGAAVLDRMVQVATEMAEALGGFVVDDNRVPLQDAGIARIKAQLQEICVAMAGRGIPAGSPRAQRLFA